MNRRYFIKQAALAAPLIVAFNPLAAARKSLLRNFALTGAYNNRVLVLIELTGGNDSLNTVIPVDKYDILSVARKNILIPDNKILKLNDSNIFGFHPSLTGLHQMYNDKLVTLIQGVGVGVGYGFPEFSHFHGINIKHTAHIEKTEIRSGWLGRYLAYKYPNYPKRYPLLNSDGPPAIEMGTVSTRITTGVNDESFGLGIGNFSGLDRLSDLSEDIDTPPDNMAGANIAAIRAVSKQIQLYGPIIKSFAGKQENLSKLYPEGEENTIALQLKTVARLIGSGMNTSIYVVNHGSYDNHGDQVDKTDTTKGKHATLLKDLSAAITAFQDDLQLMGVQDSYGTDHGTAETAILFGSKVKNGIIGKSPDLPAKVTVDDNLASQFDFRSLYGTLLNRWLGVPEETVRTIIDEGSTDRLDLFKV